MKRLCVISDWSSELSSSHEVSAVSLALSMAKAEIGLIYKGGSDRFLNTLAKSIKENGGHTTRVDVTSFTDTEWNIIEPDEHYSTNSLHECKTLMFLKSNGFLVLPGDVGALEILMECLTWMQRVYEPKPVYILNVDGFWDHLLLMFKHMNEEMFLPLDFNDRYFVIQDISLIVPDFQSRY